MQSGGVNWSERRGVSERFLSRARTGHPARHSNPSSPKATHVTASCPPGASLSSHPSAAGPPPSRSPVELEYPRLSVAPGCRLCARNRCDFCRGASTHSRGSGSRSRSLPRCEGVGRGACPQGPACRRSVWARPRESRAFVRRRAGAWRGSRRGRQPRDRCDCLCLPGLRVRCGERVRLALLSLLSTRARCGKRISLLALRAAGRREGSKWIRLRALSLLSTPRSLRQTDQPPCPPRCRPP